MNTEKAVAERKAKGTNQGTTDQVHEVNVLGEDTRRVQVGPERDDFKETPEAGN